MGFPLVMLGFTPDGLTIFVIIDDKDRYYTASTPKLGSTVKKQINTSPSTKKHTLWLTLRILSLRKNTLYE